MYKPVERVVEVWEYCQQGVGVSFFIVVSHNFQDGKHYVDSIKAIESNKKVVEADLLLPEQNYDRQGVANDSKSSKE